jgi:hypothetical protein
MIKKFLWKLWLRINLMTKDIENDYYAEVETAGHTLRNTDLARRIVDEGSEIQYETLVSIFDHGDRIKRETLLSGTSVLDGVAHFTPRVTGNWNGATHRFDPALHKITLDITPSAEMRKALAEEVNVEVLGIRDGGAYIGLVTDLSTGLTDNTVHRDEDMAIEGVKIKVAPEDQDDLGVFLNFLGPVETPLPPVKITKRYIQNDPKKVVVRLPATLPAGPYQLYIVTRFSNTSTLLKEESPRTITYGSYINVV